MITLKAIKENKGATLTSNGEEVKQSSGYQVSVRDMDIIPVYKLLKRDIVALLNAVPQGYNLGIWIDKGKAYIDISKTYKRKGYAVKVGNKNNQISVWDWKNHNAIMLREE